ncbi:hypothetical protein [Staphylococcus cohnii]|nr:hypothetical protein [Staphylococcus cohnii]
MNGEKKWSEIVSIGRESEGDIVGKGSSEKINHGYGYGGGEMGVK